MCAFCGVTIYEAFHIGRPDVLPRLLLMGIPLSIVTGAIYGFLVWALIAGALLLVDKARSGRHWLWQCSAVAWRCFKRSR